MRLTALALAAAAGLAGLAGPAAADHGCVRPHEVFVEICVVPHACYWTEYGIYCDYDG